MTHARGPVEPGRCCGCDPAPPHRQCRCRSSTGYAGVPFCPGHDEQGVRHAERAADPNTQCYRCGGRFPKGTGSACDPCRAEIAELRARVEASRVAAAATLVVVPCSGGKADGPRPAGELYTGSLHAAARAAATTVAAGIPGARVVILSALHGLVELDTVLEPYDVTMGDPGAIATDRLAAQLAGVGRVIALTPNRYTAALLDAAEVADVPLSAPLAGSRGIGEQRGRLARLRDGRATVAA